MGLRGPARIRVKGIPGRNYGGLQRAARHKKSDTHSALDAGGRLKARHNGTMGIHCSHICAFDLQARSLYDRAVNGNPESYESSIGIMPSGIMDKSTNRIYFAAGKTDILMPVRCGRL